MLGVTGDVPALEGTIGAHTDETSSVACVLNWFGPTKLLTMNDFDSTMDHDAPDSPESVMLGGPIVENKAKAPDASPITHVSKGDAPALTIHGTTDPLAPYNQCEIFHAALGKAGVPSILREITDGGHGKGFGDPRIMQRMRAFIEKHLLGKHIIVDQNPIPRLTQGSASR